MTGRAFVLQGDARSLPLPDVSVDLIVTSPPYYSLRDYRDGDESLRGQIGAEATPRAYLEALWECTAEWVRVLKPEGSLFVVIGDKYAGSDAPSRHGQGATGLRDFGPKTLRIGTADKHIKRDVGAQPKSLLGLPWRYALGCVDRLGLILRRDIIWHKPNALPESVTDRAKSSHEYVFHLVRQPRYYSAVDEIREPHADPADATRPRLGKNQHSGPVNGGKGKDTGGHPLGKLPGSVWSIPSAPLQVPARLGVDHFAAFPPALVRRVVLGWSPPGVCAACGQGRRPVAKRVTVRRHNDGRHGPTGLAPDNRHGKGASTLDIVPDYRITGYVCGCPEPTAPTRPALVLDPFAGTGTVMLTASVLGRVGIGTDLSMGYCRLARWRVYDPAERARAADVPKPPPVLDGQMELL